MSHGQVLEVSGAFPSAIIPSHIVLVVQVEVNPELEHKCLCLQPLSFFKVSLKKKNS